MSRGGKAGSAAITRDRVDFLSKYLKELKENNAAVFVGAGLSRAAGYVDWSGLMAPVATALGLDVNKESDLVSLAQYHLNANASNRHQLSQLLIDEFSDLKEPTENHALLARLPIQSYWTTNYDRLIERALEAGGRRVDAKYTNEHLATTRRGRDAVVYKMHGDIEHPDKAILSKDDYECYPDRYGPFITALSGDLIEKTFLFLGFSFTDPNLDFILSRIRTRYTTHQRQHYCISKRRAQLRGEKKADFEYAARKQALVTQDLMRFNIKTIFVEDFSEITELLAALNYRFRRRTILISGSAHDYGEWGRQATESFLSAVARELVDNDFRIANGFGLGVGGAVVTGAVQQIYSTKNRSVDEQLFLRPFPIGIKDAAERQKVFNLYRAELVTQAGIAVFFLGNKEVDGKVVNADGVRAEFELAKAKGLHVIPVGASGFMAHELWSEVMANVGVLFSKDTKKVLPLLQALGQTVSDPSELVKPLLELIRFLSKE